jgi:hypothetical protein
MFVCSERSCAKFTKSLVSSSMSESMNCDSSISSDIGSVKPFLCISACAGQILKQCSQIQDSGHFFEILQIGLIRLRHSYQVMGWFCSMVCDLAFQLLHSFLKPGMLVALLHLHSVVKIPFLGYGFMLCGSTHVGIYQDA